MTLILPDFKSRKCTDIEYCGYVVSKGPASEPPLPLLKSPLSAAYETSGGIAYFQVRGMSARKRDSEEKEHLHIDLVAPGRFSSPPKTNASIKEIQVFLAPYFGRVLSVHLKGRFIVQTADLPPFIRTAFTATIADAVQVRMTAATLAVRGAPINKISWDLRGKGPAEVVLEANAEMEFNEAYLEKGLDLLENSFRAFIAKEPSHA